MKFLVRARRFFQELASEPEGKVQYFNVKCGFGHRIRGERTEGYQALRCPACGDGVFVLPRSPLPEPAAPARKPAPPGFRKPGPWVDLGPVELTDPGQVALDAGGDERSQADAEIIWDESSRPTAQSEGGNLPPRTKAGASPDDEQFWEEDVKRAGAGAADTTRPRRAKKPGADDGSPRPTTGRGTVSEDGRSESAQRQRARRPTSHAAPARGRPADAAAPTGLHTRAPRRRPNPLIAILVVVPLLVIATVAWRYRRHLRQEYPLIAERGKNEGIPALEDGNFDKAYHLLAAAKSAVDALGGAVNDAEEIRNGAAEAALLVDQCPLTLEEMIAKAHSNPADWATTFNNIYKGRAVLIESSIAAEPEPGRSSSYKIDYVVFPPGGSTNFTDQREAPPASYGLIDLAGFQLFELARPGKGTRVTFGARLASFEYDLKNEVWLIGLIPDSGVLITHHKALEALGWQSGIEAETPPEIRP